MSYRDQYHKRQLIREIKRELVWVIPTALGLALFATLFLAASLDHLR